MWQSGLFLGPAGGALPIPAAGIFPDVATEEGIHYSELVTKDDSTSNYQGVDDEGYAKAEVQGYIDKAYLAAASSLEELSLIVDGQPVLNKIGIISKLRNGTVKRRMIFDTKQSNVKHASSKGQRVILPRLLDAVCRVLETLTGGLAAGEGVDLVVLDFQEAFWQVPLNPAERRLCLCLKVCGSTWPI